MIVSLLLLVGVAVAVPVPEVEDGWLEDLIAVVELSGPIDSGIRPTRLEPVKSRRTLPPLLAALDPEVLLKYLDKRQTEDNILEDIVVGLISTGLFPLGGGKREIEDNLWDDIVNGVESAYEWLTSPEVLSVVNAASYPIGKRLVEDGLWEDIVNTLVKASKAIDEAYIASIPVGKRQVEDGLWEDIVSFLVKTSEEINEAYTPIGKRQVEDGLWEDIVNAVVKASEALIENSGPALGKRQVKRLIATVIALYPGGLPNPLGKRQVKDARRAAGHLVTLVDPIFDWVGKRQA